MSKYAKECSDEAEERQSAVAPEFTQEEKVRRYSLPLYRRHIYQKRSRFVLRRPCHGTIHGQVDCSNFAQVDWHLTF